MQRVQIAALFLLAAYLLQPAPVAQAETASPDHVVISEVQVINGTEKGQDFVELYNPTNAQVELDGWQLKYKSTTGLTWSKKADLTGVIEPRSFYLIASSGYLEDIANNELSSGLLDTGGHICLISGTGTDPCKSPTTRIDLVGWGKEADSAEGSEGSNPVDVSEDKIACFEIWSMKRKFDNDGLIQDTDDNGEDFVIETPNPQFSSGDLTEMTVTTPTECDEPDEEDPKEEPEEPAPLPEPVYLKLDITELLPDPDKPQIDASDEFVELFNPNSQPVNLKGYILQTGSDLGTTYTFGAATIKAKSYRAFYSRDIKIGLVNQGGRAQLLDPAGTIVSELISYPKAPTGKSWAKVAGKWQWTDRSTPGGPNQAHTSKPADNATTTQPQTTTTPIGPFAKINITELLPDPDKPQTDANDEFVELFNPNDYAVDLAGYTIQTGTNFRSRHTIENLTIKPRQYIAIFSSLTRVSLTNRGGAARLLDPAGQVISTTDSYPKAETGAAWALIDGKWQWTATPTPAAKNVLTAVESASSVSVAAAQPASQDRARAVLAAPATVQTTAATNAIVAGAVGSALLYGLYEWRGDLQNQLEKFRRYRRAWRRRRS